MNNKGGGNIKVLYTTTPIKGNGVYAGMPTNIYFHHRKDIYLYEKRNSSVAIRELQQGDYRKVDDIELMSLKEYLLTYPRGNEDEKKIIIIEHVQRTRKLNTILNT